MPSAKPPSLAYGCVKLGFAFAVRHAIPSTVSALGFIVLFAVLHAIDDADLSAFPSGNLLPALGYVGEHFLEALQASLAVMIIVVAIRRVLQHAAADSSFALRIDWSFRNPLVRTAFRSSWIVFVLLGALYTLLAVSGSIIAEGGPRNVLLIPLYLVLMPLTTGGPLGLLITYSVFGAGIFILGLLAIYTVRTVLQQSGAEPAAQIDVFKSVLNRPFGLIRLVLNLTWLYGVPFILLYRWTPTLIFPRVSPPTFSQVEAALQAGADTRFSDLVPLLRSVYEGGAIAIGLVFLSLAAVVIWTRAAEITLHAESTSDVVSVERVRPWHNPETPMRRVLGNSATRARGTFGKRSG